MTNAELLELNGEAGDFTAKVLQHPRFVDISKCTACGECAKVCPIGLSSEYDAGLARHRAAYKRYAQAIPGAYSISKLGQSPCKVACPAGISVQGYVNLIAAGRYREALAVIRQENPLPAVCGRVCTHSCETACARGTFDEPIAIRDLKRFVAEWEIAQGEMDLPAVKPATGQKVAIIGSGPAGLSAAYYLALEGIGVTIFEALGVTGGMLRVGIPDYRLPPAILDYEIDYIKALGVEIRTNQRLGTDFTVPQLQDQGYEAVIMAVGAHQCLSLGVPGEDATGVQSGVEFLRQANLGQAVSPGSRVVVVGGGNVAMDSARTVLRLGSKEVTVLYRRTRAEMPADSEEIEEALEEGIRCEYLAAPKRFIVKEGRLTGVEVIRMGLGPPDASGRPSPQEISGSEYVMEIDGALSAIGQEPDLDCLDDTCRLDVGRKNCLSVDALTLQTNLPHVFAGGDAVLGPATVIQAVAQGKEAAYSAIRLLAGQDLAKGRAKDWHAVDPPKVTVPVEARKKPPHADPVQRGKSFGEVVGSLSEEAARAEASRCLACAGCAECMLCVQACLAGAVDHGHKPRQLEFSVGALILASGARPYELQALDYYRYHLSPNVVTSLEFERFLSPSGPTEGHLLRPSDQKEPKNIIWLQCVGSRDTNRCGNGYCSSVCCMYAIKQALVAKEHAHHELDCTIFNMDLRTFGKDYERYYLRARDQEGVRFVKTRVHTINDDSSGGLRIEYATNDGQAKEETFDMVVLSVGLEAPQSNAELSNRLGVDTNKYRFADTKPMTPVTTSRQGVLVCGSFQGPKDIPSSVTEASAAACVAGGQLSPARWTATRSVELPPQVDVSQEKPRIGVFVCKCGINIAGVVDVPDVTAYAATLPHVVYADNGLFVCSQDVQEQMKEKIKEHRLNRVVVASCSPKTHEPIFMDTLQACGLNKYLFEMANIRNHDSWVHGQMPELATAKAKDLVRMAVARAGTLRALVETKVKVNSRALVVGGGVAGLTAALGVADQGFEVVLVEKEAQLGGFGRQLTHTIEGADINAHLNQLIERASNHPKLQVLTQSLVVKFSGFRGNFTTELIVGPGMYERKINHGALILATGAGEYKPTEYYYGQDERVLTQVELSRRLEERGAVDLKSVAMIQCVGSRNAESVNCSRICCQSAVKNALHIKEINPEAMVCVLYRDIRTYGLMEDYYTLARQKGVLFFRYNQDDPPVVEPGEDGVNISFTDHVLGRPVSVSADLLTLSVGMRPQGVDELASVMKLARNIDGYLLEAHAKLRPVDMASEGVFVCGSAHGPKLVSESIAQAYAAAGRAVTLLAQSELALSPVTASVVPELCAACLVCVYSCPSGVPRINVDGVSEIDVAMCRGCGICAAECPAKAIQLNWYEDDQILSQVEGLLEGVM
ncbi:heterodisulfide reductase subunit A2 [Desulfarculales bacterium]